ncbi:type II secretion system protein GspL [Dasania sp. GY-MA-18]|uniref:Type II secretion system protein L n=1 Tax=Dasania phycosphaerae TaxID=2950436 RepID=A0A9J6RJR8_9GAMM|nr:MULTISPECIES: type II secretion system protein GspL [Dasania]MCR8921801.1 type II secretion system protein GspL [Dasania sp. GY-MA-18]MCZ0864229.1 type II secretion system protein GspL [Dasania phycosphaerae]MCZ0867957.1 type II secretion system protein GspL [Dasania phycosphaerae]
MINNSQHSLIIRITTLAINQDSELQWFLFDHSQQLIQKGCDALASIKEALPAAIRAEVAIHVIVPNDAVLLARVNIPSRNQRHIKQALPFAIEEFIAQDLEKVHMAMPQQLDPSHEQIDVAIIEHSLLISWLDLLHHHQLSPQTMVIDTLCVPIEPQQHSVLIDGEQVLLRLGLYHGVSCERASFNAIYSQLIAENFTEDNAPVLQCVYSQAESEAEASLNYQGAVKESFYKEAASEILAANLLKQGAEQINLLQGGYKQGKQESGGFELWRPTFIAAAASLLLFVISHLASAWYFSWQAEQLRQESISYYKQLFPNERRVVSPKRQLQNHLRLISSGEGGAFLSTLAAISAEFKPYTQTGQIAVKQLAYTQDNHLLRFELSSQTIEQLDSLKQQLSAIGIKAVIGSARAQENTVISNMTVEAQP